MTSIVFGPGKHRRLTLLDRLLDRPALSFVVGLMSALAVETGLIYGWWLAQ